ncbi:DEAD/DEAH box helicase, partial [bacterium]
MQRAITEIIEAILKPLRFASKDSFARLSTLRGLEKLVTVICSNGLTKELSSVDSTKLTFVADLFAGFDSLNQELKKDVIIKALAVLEGAADARLTAAQAEPYCEPPRISTEEALAKLQKLKTPLQYVKGIGPKLAKRLEKKGMLTVEDLLYFLPFRYEDRTKLKTIKELLPGQTETTEVKVLVLGEVRYGRRRVFEMATSDSSGILKLKWFNFRAQYMKRYKAGQRLMVYGAVSVFGMQKEIIHPDIEVLDENVVFDAETQGGIVPVYSQVENFHQKTIRKLVRNAVDEFSHCAVGALPETTLKKHGLVELSEAIRQAHCAVKYHGSFDALKARRSIVFDDLFLLELSLATRRQNAKNEEGIRFLSSDSSLLSSKLEAKLRQLLSFKLTSAQERVLSEIKNDMTSPHPMNRLVQGDVGCGKTIVSLIAGLWAIESAYQCAIMAPTEILAEQHYLTTHGLASGLGIRAAFITGAMKKSEKNKALEDIRQGKADLIIGTHALFQKDVEFKRLGLVVIDEQHRFGVIQRAALRKKGAGTALPDMLIMTATP